MNDRELLELAARAAGIALMPMEIKNVERQGDDHFIGYMTEADQWPRGWFNPLTDDGDALRLAVRLSLRIDIDSARKHSPQVAVWSEKTFAVYEHFETDPDTATRRAIVRAAAEIGRGM